MTVVLATAIDDPGAACVEQAEFALAPLDAIVSGLVVRATDRTPGRLIDLLRSHGATIDVATRNSRRIGAARRAALASALRLQPSHIVYADFDHATRWVTREPGEFGNVLAALRRSDVTVVGRTRETFERLPRRLRDTEAIVNNAYYLLTGRRWDLLMAARGFSRQAAEAIVAQCHEETIGVDVAWPLFCERRGMRIGYIEARGLTYEREAPDPLDLDPTAWARRVELLVDHMSAMEPYLPDRADQR